jgi:hypothetical protein
VYVSIFNTVLEPVNVIIHAPRGRHTQADLTRPEQTIQRIETAPLVNLNQNDLVETSTVQLLSQHGRALDCIICNSHMAMAATQ